MRKDFNRGPQLYFFIKPAEVRLAIYDDQNFNNIVSSKIIIIQTIYHQESCGEFGFFLKKGDFSIL